MTARSQDYFRTAFDQRQNLLFDRLAARPYGPAYQLDCTTHPCKDDMGAYMEQYTPLGGPNPWKWRTSFDRAFLARYNALARPSYGPAFQKDCTIRPCPGVLKEGFCGGCSGCGSSANYSDGDSTGMMGMWGAVQKKARLI
jgi:hypothetical protein